MANHSPKQMFILGLTQAGRTFRPSDWAERLAGARPTPAASPAVPSPAASAMEPAPSPSPTQAVRASPGPPSSPRSPAESRAAAQAPPTEAETVLSAEARERAREGRELLD